METVQLDELQFKQLLEAAKRSANEAKRAADLLTELMKAVNDLATVLNRNSEQPH